MAVLPGGAGDGDGEGDEETLPLPHPSRRNKTIAGKSRRTRLENFIIQLLTNEETDAIASSAAGWLDWILIALVLFLALLLPSDCFQVNTRYFWGLLNGVQVPQHCIADWRDGFSC